MLSPIQCKYILETCPIFRFSRNPVDILNKFYAIQNRNLYGIVNRNYIEKSKAILEDMKQAKSIDLSGDGRCCSRENNAKYFTYSFMDKSTKKLRAFSLTQVNETGNSNRMENMGFEKALKSLKDEVIISEPINMSR